MSRFKWADYVITDVRYNEEHTHIEQVRVYEHTGSDLVSPTIRSRKNVISFIKAGYSYVTAYKDSNGNWRRGEDVRIVRVGNNEYLRTDSNSRATDNLGELPEF